MSKEKQIEEKHELSESIYMSGHGLDWKDSEDIAEQLYHANYRKQSEGEWIFKEYSEDTYTNLTRIYECSLCGRTIECLNEADEPYCHCGAKMKGGAE